MPSYTNSSWRILPQACSHTGSARGRRRPASALTLSSRPRLAIASTLEHKHLESQPRSMVLIYRANHRYYASDRPQPPGGTYHMNLGKDRGEKESSLEQYGVDLTSKARDGKLDPVIGRDPVRRIWYPRITFFGSRPAVSCPPDIMTQITVSILEC